jgi:hypothetical protein
MKSIGGLLAVTATVAIATFGVGSAPVHAVEVLLNGGLEDSAGPQGWSLTQSITAGAEGDYNGNGVVDAADFVQWRNGGPLQNEVETPGQVTPEDNTAWRARFGNSGGGGGPISAVEHLDAAAYEMPAEGKLGLLLKPFSGNVGEHDGQNLPVNVVLSQTFPFGAAAAGRTYTFTGHSYFQVAASNNIDTLYQDSPVGIAPSPTETYFQMEFLSGSDAVLGNPIRLDLPKNRTSDTLPDDWQTHTLMGMAPAGTERIRVTAAALNMVASCTTDCPGGQDVYFDNFTLRDSSVPGLERLTNANLDVPGAPAHWTLQKTPQDNVQFSTADYARHSGNVGMWLRSFNGGDATLLQTVPGIAGGVYTFSAWSKWETGFVVADPLSNATQLLKIEFLDSANAVIGTPAMLDLRTVQTPDGEWHEVMLNGTAPTGTANVRVSAVTTGMMNTTINPQSAMFDDFSLNLAGVPGNLLAAAVPEPTSCFLICLAMAWLCGIRWRVGAAL